MYKYLGLGLKEDLKESLGLKKIIVYMVFFMVNIK